ncbi:helix-turn-helix domain-containing protein [Muricomes intestini]|jgi:DNA-binding transcriptional regulator YiaG|uniref:Helix-turn-helix protein n=1 Tax=Muricomes intestini TaxID=1796634 RepID=A0A4R3KGZ3_9FIRM|nr:helix-turn-helix domain-containing protein [Muricomes intestini]TCS82393.1 helix-turn-helix protein [Muricomes intestini]
MEIKDRVRKLRESTGMNRKEFCAYFGIPYRTVTEWELGHRKLPVYVLRMLEYQIKMEKLAKKQRKEKTNDKK